MRCKSVIALTLVLAMILPLTGCGRPQGPDAPDASTAATQPAPTVPADGNPKDVTCKGSYTAEAPAADTVVATMGSSKLTAGQLQIYYQLAAAKFNQEYRDLEPDFSQGLDTQPCPLDANVNSWQQYLLQQALNTWHSHQALAQLGQDEGTPTEPEYKPDLAKRKELMTGMPATQYLYAWSDSFRPNRLHQEYLDSLPDTLKALAKEKGYDSLSAMAAALGGSEGDLLDAAQLANRAYMYFTELSYYLETGDEEIEAWYQAHASQVTPGEKTVNIRHILLVPDDAQIASDGTVTASEDAWDRARVTAGSVVDTWQKAVSRTRYAQFTQADVPETRFAEVAKDRSQDPGSQMNGGSYVAVKQGQLTPELDAWCFDEARQHGDYEILRTACGYDIVFFSRANEGWYAPAREGLIQELSRKIVTDAMAKYPMTVDYSAISLLPFQGSSVTESDFLYPDVAHERYPDMQLYIQQDYPDAPYGNYLLKTHGCGITTLAMIATYLADEELTPVELAARYGYYCGERGSEIVMFDDTPAEMGFYLQKRTYSWEEIDNALRNGQVVVSLQYVGYWTRGGHYLAMIGLTDDGKYVVRDSNLINYKRIPAHVQDCHTRGSISEAGQYYWIYEKKITRIPACTRCGEGQGAAPGLLQQTYLCPKCRTAMARRDNFLSFAG